PSGFGQPSSLGTGDGNRFSSFGSGGGGGGGGSGSGFGQKSAFGSQAGKAKAAAKGDAPDAEFLRKMLASRPMWQFSTFGPSSAKPNLLTGTDISLEEMQLDFVLAMRSGTLPACQQKYAQLGREITEKFDAIAATADSCLQAWKAQVGDAPATPPAFGQSQPATSAFGQSQPAPALALAPATSAFGQPKPAFGQPQTASAFGQSPTTSAFGQQKSAFGQPPTTSAFGQAATGQTASAFGQPQSAFGQPLAGSSGFGSSGGGSAFGQRQGAFGQPQTAPAFGKQTSAFGQQASAFGAGVSGAGGFGRASQIDASAAESTQPLSAQDIECYNASQFTLGAIPELPPTGKLR
ncbi:hypothetical protein IWQ57_003218, partial [Coemansia nantahalensis]